MSRYDAVERFRETIAEYGLVCQELIADGRLHRCGTEGKERGRDGAYILHMDDLPVLWVKNWRTGAEGTDKAVNERALTAGQRRALQQRMEQVRKAVEQDRQAQHTAAARVARAAWAASSPASGEHRYLCRKEVPALGVRQRPSATGAEGCVGVRCA